MLAWVFLCPGTSYLSLQLLGWEAPHTGGRAYLPQVQDVLDAAQFLVCVKDKVAVS